MVPVAESDFLTLPRRGQPDADNWASAFHPAVAADPPARPVKAADAAQAHNFKVILKAEFARLNQIANHMGGPLQLLTAPGFGGTAARRELLEINGCIDEVRHLLDALQNRFGVTD